MSWLFQFEIMLKMKENAVVSLWDMTAELPSLHCMASPFLM